MHAGVVPTHRVAMDISLLGTRSQAHLLVMHSEYVEQEHFKSIDINNH